MNKYCSNCGSELKENADVCLGCGRLIKKENNININQRYDYNSYLENNYISNYTKPKIPGRGMSIAGMILGIIAASWALISLLSISDVEYLLSYYYSIVDLIGYIIDYTLFSLAPSIIGLVLSICGYRKQKNGQNISGIVLSVIALAIAVIEIVYIVTFV